MTPLLQSLSFMLASFLTGFIALRISYNHPKSLKDGFIPLWIIMLLGMIMANFFNPLTVDTLASYPTSQIELVFIGALLIYLLGSSKYHSLTFLPTIITAGLYCLLLPSGFLLFEGLLPLWLDRLSIVLIWFIISFCFQYLNASSGIMCAQAIAICLSIIIIFIIGGAPYILALYAVVVLGAMLALLSFNWFPAHIIPTQGLCQAMGFICAWLLLKLSQEGMSSSALILSTYLILESCFALFYTALPGPKYPIAQNTSYYLALLKGLSGYSAFLSVTKILLMLLILACFQLYSLNFYSIPILAALVCSLFLYKLHNWDEPDKTLKEINNNFISEVKDNISNIKDQFKDKP